MLYREAMIQNLSEEPCLLGPLQEGLDTGLDRRTVQIFCLQETVKEGTGHTCLG